MKSKKGITGTFRKSSIKNTSYRGYSRNKKGITPVIAVILLLMMTVAGAGGAFFWFVRIQSEMQGGTETYSQDVTEAVSSQVDMSNIEFNRATEVLTVYLQNIGSRSIPTTASSTTFWLFDSDQTVVCNKPLNGTYTNASNHTDFVGCSGCGTDIPLKGTTSLNLNLSFYETHDCDITSNVTYPVDTLFYVEIDFSGQTASGGQFKK